jgi:hypothetical protein
MSDLDYSEYEKKMDDFLQNIPQTNKLKENLIDTCKRFWTNHKNVPNDLKDLVEITALTKMVEDLANRNNVKCKSE